MGGNGQAVKPAGGRGRIDRLKESCDTRPNPVMESPGHDAVRATMRADPFHDR